MLTLKLRDVLEDRTPDAVSECNLYVVRDGEVIFYVGQSQREVADRVCQHCGMGRHGRGAAFNRKSVLGYLVEDNLPESLQWEVDFMTVQDCDKRFNYEARSVIEAETVLIVELRPALNGSLNRNPMPLPDKYTKGRAERQMEVIRRVLSGKPKGA